MSKAQSDRARLGGLALAASHDPQVYTANARAAFDLKFRDLSLPEPEQSRRAAAARKYHFAKLSAASARARRKSV
jgi:hypothetical protein